MPLMFSVCPNHNPILFPFMTYNRVTNNYNMTVATCGAATVYLPGNLSPPLDFSGVCVAQSLLFIVCPFVFFLLTVVLYVLPRLLITQTNNAVRRIKRMKAEKYSLILGL